MQNLAVIKPSGCWVEAQMQQHECDPGIVLRLYIAFLLLHQNHGIIWRDLQGMSEHWRFLVEVVKAQASPQSA